MFTALPLPRGLDADALTDGYLFALQGLSTDGLKSVIAKLIRGTMPNQPKFCPRPPELAQMVRDEEERMRDLARPALPGPASTAFKDWRMIHEEKARHEGRKLIHAGASIDDYRRGLKSGAYPAGSTWLWAKGVYGPPQGA